MSSRQLAPMVTGLLRSEKIVQRDYLVSTLPELGQHDRKDLSGPPSSATAIMKNHNRPWSRVIKDVAGRP